MTKELPANIQTTCTPMQRTAAVSRSSASGRGCELTASVKWSSTRRKQRETNGSPLAVEFCSERWKQRHAGKLLAPHPVPAAEGVTVCGVVTSTETLRRLAYWRPLIGHCFNCLSHSVEWAWYRSRRRRQLKKFGSCPDQTSISSPYYRLIFARLIWKG